MTTNKYIGSSIDEFLKEEGVLEEFEAAAVKQVIAWKIQSAMRAQEVDKVKMAARMKTSRTQVDRLLDPEDGNVTLETLQKAAKALDQELEISFRPKKKAIRKRKRITASVSRVRRAA